MILVILLGIKRILLVTALTGMDMGLIWILEVIHKYNGVFKTFRLILRYFLFIPCTIEMAHFNVIFCDLIGLKLIIIILYI